MPRLTRWMLRAALIHLLTGFTLGALLLANKGIPFYPRLWQLLPAHIEFLLLGWTVQLAFGVAYWILPRFQTARPRSGLVWATLLLLNAGVWMVAAAPFTGEYFNTWTIAGRLSEAISAMTFALHAWPRIKPAMS